MADQFLRRVALSVGKPGAEGRQWSALRIAFVVSSSTNREPNTARIQVYNLNADSRAALEARGLALWLAAGGFTPLCPSVSRTDGETDGLPRGIFSGRKWGAAGLVPPPFRSGVDCAVAAGEGCFAHGFAIGGMRVAGKRKVLCRSAKGGEGQHHGGESMFFHSGNSSWFAMLKIIAIILICNNRPLPLFPYQAAHWSFRLTPIWRR